VVEPCQNLKPSYCRKREKVRQRESKRERERERKEGKEGGKEGRRERRKEGRKERKGRKKGKKVCWALVAHTYNPSYSGGRDQEDRSSKLALGK
jgi:hypothetical protein